MITYRENKNLSEDECGTQVNKRPQQGNNLKMPVIQQYEEEKKSSISWHHLNLFSQLCKKNAVVLRFVATLETYEGLVGALLSCIKALDKIFVDIVNAWS